MPGDVLSHLAEHHISAWTPRHVESHVFGACLLHMAAGSRQHGQNCSESHCKHLHWLYRHSNHPSLLHSGLLCHAISQKAACGHKKSQQQIAKLSPSEVWFGLLPFLFPWPLNILHRKKSKKKHPHPPTNKALSKCQKAEFHKQRQHSFGSIFKKSVLLKKSLH